MGPVNKLKQAVEVCIREGISVPEPLRKIAVVEDRLDRGVIQVWKCRAKLCGKEYESLVPINAWSCECGHLGRKVWPK